MKLVADRQPLLAALQHAACIAARGSTLPILGRCLLQAGKGRLAVVANDAHREVAVSIDAQVGSTGATTVDSRLLSQFVAGIADGMQIELSLAAERLTVRAGRARATFLTLPAAGFPRLEAMAEHESFELEGASFAVLLRTVAHAQSREETRYFLNGVYLHRRSARELVAVATDGHRLAKTVLAAAADLPDFAGAIVPTSAVEELASLADDVGTLALAVSGRLVRAEAGDVVFTTRLIDATYPDYERVIPAADIATGFEVDRAAFVQALKRVGVFVEGDKIKAKLVKLSPAGRALELMASGEGEGEISDEIDAETTSKQQIGANAAYLAAALEALGGKTTRVRYADAGSPMAFTDPAEPNRLQIVMARRV